MRSKGTSYTTQEVKLIFKLFVKLRNFRKVADITHRSRTHIRRLCIQEGLHTPRIYKNKISRDDKAIISDYVNGMTMLDLVAKYNKSYGYVNRKLHQSGVYIRTKNNRVRKDKPDAN